MSVGGVLFLSSFLCWWSFLSVRRVVLKVGCVLSGFATARARKRKRWWLGSRARVRTQTDAAVVPLVLGMFHDETPSLCPKVCTLRGYLFFNIAKFLLELSLPMWMGTPTSLNRILWQVLYHYTGNWWEYLWFCWPLVLCSLRQKASKDTLCWGVLQVCAVWFIIGWVHSL